MVFIELKNVCILLYPYGLELFKRLILSLLIHFMELSFPLFSKNNLLYWIIPGEEVAE